MDRFIIRSRKNNSIFDDVKTAVCVWGPYGCGKTTWVKEQFDILEINYDNPSEYMDRIPNSRFVLIDNFDALDSIFEKWFSRPRTIYISNSPLSGVYNYEMNCKKNLRNLFGDADIRLDPREYIDYNLMTNRETYIDMVTKCSSEHGNGMGIVHENYTSCCTLAECVDVSMSLSVSSEIDTAIYKGQWDNDTLMFFNVMTYAYPCSIIKGRLSNISAASMWSKYLNGCMKKKKLRDLDLDIWTLCLLRDYASKDMNPLSLSSPELDVLNYIDFYKKLKVSTLQKLKKCQKTMKNTRLK